VEVEGKTIDSKWQSDLTKSDIETMVANKQTSEFTKETAVTGEITVYAVYVKSSDASIAAEDGFKIKEAPKQTETTDLSLKKTSLDGESTSFDAKTLTYFATASSSADYVYISLKFDDTESTVKYYKTEKAEGSDTAADKEYESTVKDGAYTVYIPLDTTSGNKATNTVKMTVKSPDGTVNTYTFNILRFADARVQLAYGNSPYGRIMQDSSLKGATDEETAANQKAAKEAMAHKNEAGAITYWYKSASNPDKEILYLGDQYDTDEYCYFKLIRMDVLNTTEAQKALVDPGFTAYNSYNEEVPYDKVTREITVKTFTSYCYLTEEEASASGANAVTSVKYTKTGTESFDEFVLATKIVPGVYEMKYTFEDFDGTEITKTRNIAVVYPRGDVDLTGEANNNDVSNLRLGVNGKTPLSSWDFYKMRMPNVNVDKDVDNNDITDLRNGIKYSSIYEPYTN
jgi:hypothetical protein